MNLKLGSFFGIPLRFNLFTILFVAFIYFTTPNQQNVDGIVIPYLDILTTASFILTLVFIVLHEYGHCLMAQKMGWNVYDVTIYPIGGIARMSFKHTNPTEEILVIAAGPAVNFVLAVLFAICLLTTYVIDSQAFVPMFIFVMMFILNIFIVVFNMLPIFPMDGGRILRALLTFKMGHLEATRLAVRTGQILGVVFVVLSLYYGFYFTGIILAFIILQSQQEVTNAQIVQGLHNLRRKTAAILDKPELETADLPELITALETTKQDLPPELLPLFKELHADGTTI